MKKLSEVVNVVPVIAKSDGLTLEEREAFKVRTRIFFGFGQAVACTEAGHKAMKPNGKFDGPNDPRVQSVQKIYRYYKQEAQTGKKLPKVSYVDNKPEFRWALLQDEMAWDKLHEGIKKFAEDSETLKSLLRTKLQ
ncbi:hypothetical protein PPACK8108_LOCUS20330 [Phakopsora pachyrhizi]|uniref:Septin-type G domain-containing protein n=1 Tax=Phakopsora pachyrhizi TaxID=170000 RepID=A0AAV0BI59_PHAPC|nr:hypothetical protein PPACK8108_LOCUS20330 [Phakopsora pachyrhizi]